MVAYWVCMLYCHTVRSNRADDVNERRFNNPAGFTLPEPHPAWYSNYRYRHHVLPNGEDICLRSMYQLLPDERFVVFFSIVVKRCGRAKTKPSGIPLRVLEANVHWPFYESISPLVSFPAPMS